jgi:chromate transport protein ChrA
MTDFLRPDIPTTRPSFFELTATFARIGLLSFGGPAGQIGMMHRILVDERRWISEERFLHALNYCMLLPGPEAQQLATYCGWLLHGRRGGIIAGALFIVPGFIVIVALAAAYALYQDTHWQNVPLSVGLLCISLAQRSLRCFCLVCHSRW